MHPILRVVLVVIGAAFGASLATDGINLLGALLGALAVLGISEAVFLRGRIASLHGELRALRELAQDRATRTETVAPPPPQEPAPYYEQASARQVAAHSAPPAPVATADVPSEPQPAPAWQPRPMGLQRPLQRPADNALVALLRDYFTGGNALVRAGIVVLLFGVGFLLRYLSEHTHIPIEFRLCGVALAALVLLVLGWRLRKRRLGYALALQGGAVGILYLTVFSALHLYSVLSPATAFALLAAISALSATLAVLQNSLAVALLSVTGGFLAPFLASTGHGDHVALFSYFAVLNAAILAIAWFRSWKLLNLAGFAFTFVLSTAWGVLQYRPEDFPTSEPFLIGFFLLYVAIAILFSVRQAPILSGYLDGAIIFGTPIAAFGLQSAMLHDQPLALAYSALTLCALYLALAWLLHRRNGPQQRLLAEAFMALGVAFLTLAVPLALNGRWSSASWALEGAALVWVGCRQDRRLARAFGALLQLAAGCALTVSLKSGLTVPAGTYVAALMVGVASIYASRTLHEKRPELAEYETAFPPILFVWGLLWWCVGGLSELPQHFAAQYQLASSLVFATFTAVICGWLASRARMRISLWPALGLLPLMLLYALWAAGEVHHPLAQGGWVAWPLAFVGLYFILRQHDDEVPPSLMNMLHATASWLLLALLSWELAWAIDRIAGSGGAWSIAAWGVIPAAGLAMLPTATERIAWPFHKHRQAYALLAAVGISLYLVGWSLLTNLEVSSPSAPLPYVPFINPLDLAQGLVLIVLTNEWRRLRTDESFRERVADPRPVTIGIALVGFVWLNAVLLRTLHLWENIPYERAAMMHSTLAQSALSLLWAFTALATMLLATRTRARLLWLAGSALLAVVVLKLFLIDLSGIGTVERIVSFIGVGLLMLIIGYVSPLPPVAEESP